MLFQRIKRSDPEKVFAIFKNNEATAMVDGDCVVTDTTAADGVGAKYSTAAVHLNTIGIVAGNDIAAGDYGTVQVYGYHPNVKGNANIVAAATSIKNDDAVARNVELGAVGDEPQSQIGHALAATAAGRVKVFLRCM